VKVNVYIYTPHTHSHSKQGHAPKHLITLQIFLLIQFSKKYNNKDTNTIDMLPQTNEI